MINKRVFKYSIKSLCGIPAAIYTLFCMAVTSGTVLAQSGSLLTIEEITVTARKTEENLQDVPISITAFSARDIENHGFQSLEDIDTTVPNFKLNKGQGYAADTSISIRGVTSREASAGFEPTIAVVLDDVYIGRTLGFNSTLLDLERIEVLRGPQGTLQGRNVVGGSINMTTSKPSDEFRARGKVSYGRFNSYKVSGLVTGPLQEGVLAGKVAFSHSDGDGFGENVDLDEDLGGIESTAVRAQLRFTPSENLEILLTGDYTTDDINDTGLDTDPDFTIASPSSLVLDRDYGGDFLNDSERDIYGGAVNIYYDLDNGMRLASVTSYRGFDFESILDQDNSANITNGGGFAVHSRAFREQEQISQEIRLHSAQDQSVRWLLGLYYFHEDLDTTGSGTFGPFIPGVGTIGTDNLSDANVETDSFAVFGSVSIDFFEQWNFTVGLRYDNNDRDLEVAESSRFDGLLPPPPFPPGLPPSPFIAVTAANPVPTSFAIETPFPTNTSSVSDEEFTGDLTLTYKWNDDISTYAKYARGFKGGGFNAQFSFGQAGGTVLPEFVNNYEIGLRSFWFDQRLRLNATVFYLKYNNQQVVDFIAGPAGITFITSNAPETKSYGAEIEAAAVLAEGLTMNMSLGILDSEFTRGADDGNTPLDSPDVTFSSVLQYIRPIGNNLELFLMGEASYSDDYFTDKANIDINRQDDYWMLNIRGGIQSADGKWAVRLYGKNLLDEDIQTTSLQVPGVFTLLSLADPITYGVEASFNY